MKKGERRHGQKERERRQGSVKSGGVVLWRKIHTKHTRMHASTHTPAPPTHTHKHTHTKLIKEGV